MNSGKLVRFIERWRELERQTKDLDFQRSVFARDLRKEFAAGSAGDDQFTKWCETELGLNAAAACELLTRARAVEVCADEKTYARVGGFKAVRHVIALPKRAQVEVIEAAKSQHKNVLTVVREREKAKNQNTPAASKVASSTAPTLRYSSFADAKALAEFIHEHCEDMPASIRTIVGRYVDAKGKKAA